MNEPLGKNTVWKVQRKYEVTGTQLEGRDTPGLLNGEWNQGSHSHEDMNTIHPPPRRPNLITKHETPLGLRCPSCHQLKGETQIKTHAPHYRFFEDAWCENGGYCPDTKMPDETIPTTPPHFRRRHSSLWEAPKSTGGEEDGEECQGLDTVTEKIALDNSSTQLPGAVPFSAENMPKGGEKVSSSFTHVALATCEKCMVISP